MPVQITQTDIIAMNALLRKGDRGGAYLYYYNLIKDVNRDAASQILIQAQITTYSGFFGGAALIGNAIAKNSNPDKYPAEGLDKFSSDIVQGLIDAIVAELNINQDGVLTKEQIQFADRGVWENKYKMGDYFPGNFQIGGDQYKTPGTLSALLAGSQLILGTRIGNEASKFSGSAYERIEMTDYTAIRERSSNKIVYVADKLGLVDKETYGLANLSASQLTQEATLALVRLGALTSLFGSGITLALGGVTGLSLLAGTTLLNQNSAASQAVFTGIRSLLNSIFEGVPFDNALAFDFKRFLGADGIPVNPNASLPSKLVWNEQFGLVLRNEGSFSGTANPDIIVGFRTALVAAGAGEDFLIGFDQSQIRGGAGRDWLLGAGSARILGEADNDLLIATDIVKADGGAGNDIIVGIGSQYKSLIERMELRGGDGDDWLLSYKGTGAFLYGGEGRDFLLAYGGENHLWGGTGQGNDGASDSFGLMNNTFVHDAGTDDYMYWAGIIPLFGGVRQTWNEDGWAYWSPFSSLSSVIPFGNVSLLGAFTTLIDVPMMATFRYGLTTSNQLLVQFGRGRGGQAVIENYSLDLDTGAATGHVTVFQLEVANQVSIGAIRRTIKLALAAGFGATFSGTDPLVLDLDGDGIELTSQDNGVYFDLDKDGFAEKTGWVKGDDAFLARDLNNNGKIDDISELFGNATTTGFAALKVLDTNNDNLITSTDTGFSSLRLWRDLNKNGATDAGELTTLAQNSITTLSLSATNLTNTTIQGNIIRATARLSLIHI